MASSACPLCASATSPGALAEAGWASAAVIERLTSAHLTWRKADGACPACVQQALLEVLVEHGEPALHEGIQHAWPLDAEAAFGAMPTPLRLHADPRYSGRGVTLALLDSGFYPHPDLVQPHNRIRAWVDAGGESVDMRWFDHGDMPRWPGWDRREGPQWHGLMTSVAAAGNGWLSHGLYRGLASEAELVLIQVRDEHGRITNETITRALRWLFEHGGKLGVRVVSMSVSGDPVDPLVGNSVDEAIGALVARGVFMVAAAGNDGRRQLIPPATAPLALTVGGLDDGNTFDHDARRIWHSNYGDAANGASKPELVAPSIWVVAPVLPGTDLASEASDLFAQRASGYENVEERIGELKLVTPHYQHVEGTSFAAPLAASVAACMLEANPSLQPLRMRELMTAATSAVPGADRDRQGAGALEAPRAVALALAARFDVARSQTQSPQVHPTGVTFRLHDPVAREVRVLGNWNGWRLPGLSAQQVEHGVWQASLHQPGPGPHAYKFLLDGHRWLTDPLNPRRASNGQGGWNSVLGEPGA